MKKNMEIFDELAAELFVKLYETFPVPQNLDCLSLMGHPPGEIDEYGRAPPDTDVCLATINWLNEEGFIKIQSRNTYGLSGVVLTSKGLSVLKATPEVLEAKKTLGERLVSSVNAGGAAAATKLIRLIFAAT